MTVNFLFCKTMYSLQPFRHTFKLRLSSALSSFKSTNASQNVLSSPVQIQIADLPLSEFLWQNVDKWHDKTALVCAETGRKYLYSDVFKKSRGLANFLAKYHLLRKNDTVAIILPNVPEYPIILLGAIEAGMKVTTINPSYTPDEMTKQLMDSHARVVFTTNKLYGKVKKATGNVFTRVSIPTVIVKTKPSEDTPSEAVKFEEISQPATKLEFQPKTKSEDVIILPYSSGTMGLPKGVQLTNRNIVSALQQMNAKEYKMFENADVQQDVLPHMLPMFHIYGLTTVTLSSLFSGTKMITIPKFTPNVFLNILENEKPTVAYLAPPLVLMMINNPNILPRHITQIREILSGAAPLGLEDTERFHKKTQGKVSLIQGYGLTEISPPGIQQTNRIKNGVKDGGIGFPFPNTDCKIVSIEENDAGTALGANQSGELWLRGPQVMKGYLNNPKATKDVMDEDGWFKTGDVGHYDDDGHFFITDRLKEIIKVKGFQVAPAELESLLRAHPSVEDAAVVGIPHPEFGEVPKAFIVAKKNSNVNSKIVQDYIASKVAKYKQLTGGVAIIENIPKTASGKILRRELLK